MVTLKSVAIKFLHSWRFSFLSSSEIVSLTSSSFSKELFVGVGISQGSFSMDTPKFWKAGEIGCAKAWKAFELDGERAMFNNY